MSNLHPLKRADVLRAELLRHSVFASITDLSELRVFMEHHVYAVWDFMSLLKRLQRELTCVDVPWVPGRDALAARLINDIVLAEESDADDAGGFGSHFQLYLAAMEDVGADTGPVRCFVLAVSQQVQLEEAFARGRVPQAAACFTRATLDVARRGSLEEVLGNFFYGREDVIPEMFSQLLATWRIDPVAVPRLTYYLERHVHLDRDEHGPAAQRLIARLFDDDEPSCRRLGEAACTALELRAQLWTGVQEAIHRTRIRRSASG